MSRQPGGGGGSKTPEDTEKYATNVLPPAPTNPAAPGPKAIRILYAIHELLSNDRPERDNDPPSRLVGLITLKSLLPTSLPEANHLFPPSTRSPSNTVLTIEIGYLFLPTAWGRGFATEAVKAVLEAAKRAPMEVWGEWEKVYVQAVVDKGNAGSKRVMEKSGMRYLGEYKWVAGEGGEAWMCGERRGWMELCFWGMWVVE